MKGKSLKTDSKYNLYKGKDYEILELLKEDGQSFYKIRTGDGTIYVLSTRLMIPIYEIGDMVKIIKNIGCNFSLNNSEIGNIDIIESVVDSKWETKVGLFFPYKLRNQLFLRCNEELEIVKTKYQHRQEQIKNIDKKIEQEKLKKEQINEFASSCSDLVNYCYKNTIINTNPINTYKKGDTLKIIDGQFKDIEGTFIDYVKGYDKVLLKIDDLNSLYVDSTKVMLTKKKVNNIHEDEKYDDIIYDLDTFSHPIEVRFHKNHTYVTLSDGTKARSSCYPDDEFNEEEGIRIAFFRAMAKRYENKLKNRRNS